MKIFDNVFTWFFILAIVAVVVGSGKADGVVKAVGTVLTQLINVIVSPQTGGDGKTS
jgi:hypothetical protein